MTLYKIIIETTKLIPDCKYFIVICFITMCDYSNPSLTFILTYKLTFCTIL